MDLHGVSKGGITNSVAPSLGKIDKGVGGKAGAEGAQAVSAADVPKIAHEVAQSLSAAADKFSKLASVNPFSQKAGMMMDIFAKGHAALNEAINSWGDSIRKEAAANKEADLKSQIQKQELRLDPAARNRVE